MISKLYKTEISVSFFLFFFLIRKKKPFSLSFYLIKVGMIQLKFIILN